MHAGGSRRDGGRGRSNTSRRRTVGAWAAGLGLGTLAWGTLGLGATSVAAGSTPAPSAPSGIEALTNVPSNNFWLAECPGRGVELRQRRPVRLGGGPAAQPPDRRHHPDPRRARATGWWPPTAGSSPTATPNFYGSTGAIALNKPIVGHDRHPRRQGILAGGHRRRDLLLRRRRLLRLDRIDRAQQADRRHGRHARRQGVLARGLRRRDLLLRRRRLLRLDRVITLNKPIVGMAPTPDGKGYWLVASDGGIFNFGDAGFYGSPAGGPGLDPTEKVVSTDSGQGYWVEDAERHGLPVRRRPGRAAHRGADVLARDTRGQGSALRLRPTRASPTSGAATGPSATTAPGWPWRRGRTGPAWASPGWPTTSTTRRAARSRSRASRPETSCSGVRARPTGRACTTRRIYVGGDQIVEATGDHVQLNSLDQWGLSDLMPNGRRP